MLLICGAAVVCGGPSTLKVHNVRPTEENLHWDISHSSLSTTSLYFITRLPKLQHAAKPAQIK